MPQSEHPYHALMLQAVELASKGRWITRPNPCVGALLVNNGEVLAQGWHKGADHAHAEVEALSDAATKGVNPAECVLVVTLEPCNHHGKTPPCTDALLKAGVRHVIIGTEDPNPKAGGGAQLLREAGVRVEMGVARQACLDLIDDFITWQNSDLPYTIIKLASTLDGRIATRAGHSKWITSPETRRHVHDLRKHMQAVIIGGNTFYQDNPLLTCRTPEENAHPVQPLAIVATSRLPEAGTALHLLQERPESVIFWTTAAAAASPKAETLRRCGVRVLGLSSQAKSSPREHSMRAELDLAEGLASLRRDFGCHYTLCEGGGALGLSLLEKNLAHRLYLHLAPKIFGDNEATPLFDGRAPVLVAEALQLHTLDIRLSSEDLLITLKPVTPEQESSEATGKGGE